MYCNKNCYEKYNHLDKYILTFFSYFMMYYAWSIIIFC